MPDKVLMKFTRRSLVASLGLCLAMSASGYFVLFGMCSGNSLNHKNILATFKDDNGTAYARLREKASSLTGYVKANNYNSNYCFLVDMRINSGKKRFFVYNLQKDMIERSGLVAHGSGSDRREEELYFSNEPNSNCTSLGKYKIGKSEMGRFGLAYKLYGLESSNSNALDRFVVLHAHENVPDDEIDPYPLCESWGCPMVAPAFLQDLKKYIDASSKPILLWIYY
jgi:hypothetical protein